MNTFTSDRRGRQVIDADLTNVDIRISQDPDVTRVTVAYPDGVAVSQEQGSVRIRQKASGSGIRSVFSSNRNTMIVNSSDGVVIVGGSSSMNIIKTGRNVTVISSTESDIPYVEVTCPEGSDLTICTMSADVRAWGISGATSVSTVAGDVELAACSSMDVKTTSGDVSAAVIGSARVETVSGDVRLRPAAGAVGPVRVSSVSGDVHTPGLIGLEPKVRTKGDWHPY